MRENLAPATVAILLLTLFLGFLPFRKSDRSEDRNPLNPAKLFMLYLLVQLGVSGLISVLVAHLTPYSPEPTTNQGVYLESAFLAFASVVAFNFGHWNIRAKRFELSPALARSWNERRQAQLAAFLYVAGYAAAAGLVASAGGLAAMLASREEFRSGGINGKGYFVFPMTMGITMGALLAVDLLVRRPPRAMRNVVIAVAILVAMAPAVLTGFRGLILLPIAVMAIYFHYNVHSVINRKGIAFFATLLVTFTAYGVWRELPAGVSPVPAIEAVAQTQPALFFGPLTRSAGLEATAQYVKTMEDPRVENEWFLPGFYETLTIPIPQSLWSDKPEPANDRSGRIFFLNELRAERGADWENPGGIAPTLVAWAYWQGNLLGVVVASFAFGWIFRRLVEVQKDWGRASFIRIGFAFLSPGLILSAESPQGYANIVFQNALLLGLVTLWLRPAQPADVSSAAPLQPS